jgi:hypothetical protein
MRPYDYNMVYAMPSQRHIHMESTIQGMFRICFSSVSHHFSSLTCFSSVSHRVSHHISHHDEKPMRN